MDRKASVRASFDNKLRLMAKILAQWANTGKRGDEFWPETLAQLKGWEEPSQQLYAWSSNSVTQRNGQYGDLVARYWQLQEAARNFKERAGRGSDMAIADLNVVLVRQNAELVWSVMELRDALVRLDPQNEALRRVPLP